MSRTHWGFERVAVRPALTLFTLYSDRARQLDPPSARPDPAATFKTGELDREVDPEPSASGQGSCAHVRSSR